jgi:hypothetical protein
MIILNDFSLHKGKLYVRHNNLFLLQQFELLFVKMFFDQFDREKMELAFVLLLTIYLDSFVADDCLF